MDAYLIGNWVEVAGVALRTGWSREALTDLAKLEIPSDILGDMAWIIKGDAAATWAQWFLDSMIDGARYENNQDLGFAHLYAELFRLLREEFRSTPQDEVCELAACIAKTAWQEISFRREAGRRKAPDKRQRKRLWLRNEPNPRCYLCGYAFCEGAKGLFLGSADIAQVKKPLLFDFMRPRGLYEVDLTIQIDHVRPVRAGGATDDENLKLACGWCNRAKSDHMQIYGASSWSGYRVQHPLLGWVSVPRPLWVVRMVQLRGRCEDHSGCSARLSTHELFVAPKRRSGALNPSNCSVYCGEHDPWHGLRFVGEKVLPSRPK